MTTSQQYGMWAALAGAVFAALWWRRGGPRHGTAARDTYGETIYSNTPEPTGLGGGPT
jgi:hypothetical protein